MMQLYKAFRIFFTSLGVIFFVLLIILAYVFFADPFHIRPLLNEFMTPSNATTTPAVINKTKNPLLKPAQEQALLNMGIDPAKLPRTITPQMEACFVRTLGQQRTNEIKNGSAPTAADFFTARACL